jgi:hypothetical protein
VVEGRAEGTVAVVFLFCLIALVFVVPFAAARGIGVGWFLDAVQSVLDGFSRH